MQDPIIKVRDIAWIRLGAPDLDQAEGFLTDFGLRRQVRTGTRSTCAAPERRTMSTSPNAARTACSAPPSTPTVNPTCTA